MNSSNVTSGKSVVELASSYTMYKIDGYATICSGGMLATVMNYACDGINKSYFPILVPIGVIGNILSFLVMVQKHNRHMSISLYIAVLAVTDTIALLIGFTSYLNSVHNVDFLPNQEWYCKIATAVLWTSTLSSTLFILSMTFERFYAIIRPHKAASFNTVKRAKITVVCIIIFCLVFNIPWLFVIISVGRQCAPDLNPTVNSVYNWGTYVVQFALPFVLLLAMNSVIIHTLRTRSVLQVESRAQGQGQSQGQSKSSEKQIYAMLLLVAFSFMILISPLYMFSLYITFVDYTKTPYRFAAFTLFYNVAHKMYYTNNGVNFFMYVISGNRFRTDLVNMFKRKNDKRNASASFSNLSDSKTNVSAIDTSNSM